MESELIPAAGSISSFSLQSRSPPLLTLRQGSFESYDLTLSMLENQGPRVAFEAILVTPPQNQWLAGQVNREFRAALWLTRTCISTSTRLVLSPAHISVPSRFPTTTTHRQHRGARLSRTSAVYLRYEPQKDPMCKGGAIIKCRSVVSHKSHRPKSRLQDQNEKSPHPDCVVADFPRVPAQRLPRYGQASAFEAKPSVTEYA
jgi:hypothetical protein